jgi:hypothetical protein
MENYVCALQFKETSFYLFNLRFMSEDTVETSNVQEYSTKYPGPYTIVCDDELTGVFGKLMENTDKFLKFKIMEENGKHFMETYTHKFYMRGEYLKGRDWIIPLLGFDKTYECLPYTYYIVSKGVDLINKRNVDEIAKKHVLKILPEPSAPPVPVPALAPAQVQVSALAQVQLPRPADPYMWKCLMEGALFRKESCPISLEELTIENICILPCMHCMDVGSARAMPRRQCPVCRKDFKAEDLVRYQK